MTTRKTNRASSGGSRTGSEDENGNGSLSMSDAVRRAVTEFAALTRKDPEAVTGVRSDDDGGWSVLVDVVELERIPSSTDVLATYRVDITSTGDLAGYERLRRYHRGATDPT